METINGIKEKIKNIFNENKKIFFIFLLGCCGMLLIMLSELVPEDEAKSKNITQDFNFTSEEREILLEKRLEECISKIKGVGKTEVMLTLDSSEEYFYAENYSDEKNERESHQEKEIIIIEGENGEKPIILKKTEAIVRGVLVICEGGKNSVIRERVIEAVCALLDIPSNRVSVAEMV